MPNEVKTAEEATEIAVKFTQKYRWFARPIKAARDKATREGDVWQVELDVGPIFTEVAKFKIDAKSGDILEYSFPS